MKRNLILSLLFVISFIEYSEASTSFFERHIYTDEKKTIILNIKTESGENNKFDNSGKDTGRSLMNTQIFAELYNGVLSFSPYNIIGETFVFRIYDKEEEDVLWQKVCRYSELNNIILPNLSADTYIMTFETNEGVFATDIAL